MTWDSCIAKTSSDVESLKVATLDCLPVIFQNFVAAAFVLGGITAVIMIVLSGIKMILSNGDAKKLDGARHTLMLAIAGLIIILLSVFIIQVVGFVTGTGCFSNKALLPGTQWWKNCQ